MVNKKNSLSKRYQTSYESKESSTSSRKGIMAWNKLEREVEFFSPQEGRNRINILPYEIKTKNHPLVKKGDFEVGDKDYLMDIFVHKNVGPSESTVVCLKSSFGKPCPICEQALLLRKQGKEDEAKELRPSRRAFYNVEDLKDPGKVKVFEVSHFLFEKELIDEARNDERGGFVDFADEEDGKEIKFRCSKVSKGGFEFNEFKSFSFEDREEALSSKLLKKVISFDEIMAVPTYEEVEKLFFGSDEEEEKDEEDEKPKKKKVVEDDSDEEDEKPKKKKVVEDDSDDEEEDDDNEEDEPKPKKLVCPCGFEFGKDADEYDECDDCDIWGHCVKGCPLED